MICLEDILARFDLQPDVPAGGVRDAVGTG